MILRREVCAKCKFITELPVYKVLLCFTLLPGGVTVYLDKKLPQVPLIVCMLLTNMA